MAKRLRFIPKGLPPQPYYGWKLPEGVLLTFTVRHPGNGNAHGVRVEEHESGDLVVVGPPFVFRALSDLLGDGDRPAKQRASEAVQAVFGIQDVIDKNYFSPKP